MTGQVLVTSVRRDYLDDLVGDEASFLWKTPEILAALTRAQAELARNTLVLHDDTTPAVCEIALAAVDGAYPRVVPLSNTILRLDRVEFPGKVKPLASTTVSFLDQADVGWNSQSGTPSFYVPNLSNHTLTLNRAPVSGGTLRLVVRRLPLSGITLNANVELSEYEEAIINGALSRLYMKPDGETYDPQRAAHWRALFKSDLAAITQDEARRTPSEAVMRPERW